MNPLKAFTPLHVAWLFALMFLPACEQSSIEMVELRKADTLTLYSIDGVTQELIPDLPLPDGEKFYNYPVLGHFEIPAGPMRDELLEEFAKCMANRREAPSKCVFPRHALRGSKGQQNIDFVIC